MENNNLDEKEIEKALENTVIIEKKPNNKLKMKMERFKKKPKMKIEGFNFILSVLLCISICTILYGIISIKFTQGITKEQKWEYKTVSVKPSSKSNKMGTGAGDFSTIELSEEQLNQLGIDGWELVSSYLEMETSYPNFADQRNVTGIKPNVRPQDVVLLFKRPAKVK